MTVTKTGLGTQVLSGPNTYSGNTLVSQGTLALGNGLALQDSTLDTSGSGAVSFGPASATLGGLQGPGNLILTNTASTPVALSVGNNGANTTYSGALSGGNGLTKVGSGMLTLTAAQAYGGATNITGGTLQLTGAPAALLQSQAVLLDASQSATLATSSGTVTGWTNVGTSGGVAVSISGSKPGIAPTLAANAFGNLPGVLMQAGTSGGTTGTAGTLMSLPSFYTNGNTISEFVVAKQTAVPYTGSGEMSLLDISTSSSGVPSNSNSTDYLAPSLLLEGNWNASGKMGTRNDLATGGTSYQGVYLNTQPPKGPRWSWTRSTTAPPAAWTWSPTTAALRPRPALQAPARATLPGSFSWAASTSTLPLGPAISARW